jgi:predicted membrane chloride channel (bestrophin family)
MNITRKFIAQSMLVGLVIAMFAAAYEYIFGPISGNFWIRGISIGIFCGFATVTFLSMWNKKR